MTREETIEKAAEAIHARYCIKAWYDKNPEDGEAPCESQMGAHRADAIAVLDAIGWGKEQPPIVIPLLEESQRNARTISELTADRNRHRDNERRLRGVIYDWGLTEPPGSEVREAASEALYGAHDG